MACQSAIQRNPTVLTSPYAGDNAFLISIIWQFYTWLFQLYGKIKNMVGAAHHTG